MSINVVVISGNATRDAELRQVGGSSVLEFGVCVNDRRKNEAGEWVDVPNFVDCTMWGKRAEALAPMITKGKALTVSGRLHWRQWQGKDGSSRSKLDVVASEVVLPPRPKAQAAQDDGFDGWFE